MGRPRKAPKGDIYIARESFTTIYEGVPIVVQSGVTRVREGHPVMAGREDLFELIDVHYEVEQATAAPGEKRG